MTTKTLRNFHLPLHEELHQALKAESKRLKRPVTELARQALELWLKQQQQLALRNEISAYALEFAGTQDDLDPTLEASAVEHLFDEIFES